MTKEFDSRQDKTRQDKTRQDKTRQDKTRQDKTSLDNDTAVPAGKNEYGLVMHPSVLSIPPATIDAFVAMNASIRSNHERLRAVYAEHVTNSKGAISKTAERALSRAPEGKQKTALILGAGNCLDIPLVDLTTKFDKVTLVEVDHKSTEAAVKELPRELQRKTEIVAADVTGFVGDFAGKIQPATVSSLPEFLRRATTIAKQTDVRGKGPDLGTDYTFVSSQLVMTQLASLPHDYLQTAVRKRYGTNLSSMPGGADHDLFMNMQRVTLELQQEHIRQLSELANPNGTVHLADTYAKLVPIPFSDQQQIWPMVLTTKIDPVVEQHFTSIPQEPNLWIWDNSPGNYKFAVMAHSFDPKL